MIGEEAHDDAHWLKELLAFILQDNGYVQRKQGTEKAVKAAIDTVNSLYAKLGRK